MHDGHDDDDGVFGIPPASVIVTGNICRIGSSARSVTAKMVMAFVLPLALSPCGRTPRKRKMQTWDFPAAWRRVYPPLRSEKSSDFSDCVYRV